MIISPAMLHKGCDKRCWKIYFGSDKDTRASGQCEGKEGGGPRPPEQKKAALGLSDAHFKRELQDALRQTPKRRPDQGTESGDPYFCPLCHISYGLWAALQSNPCPRRHHAVEMVRALLSSVPQCPAPAPKAKAASELACA